MRRQNPVMGQSKVKDMKAVYTWDHGASYKHGYNLWGTNGKGFT